jgi:RNA polymerase sigma factor (TIGR02999 family)
MAGERAGHSLQASALLNEAYLRLIHVEHVTWQDRNHFLSMAARLMRRVLVEAARAKRRGKRGADAQKITFDEALIVPPQPGQDLVALDDALEALAKIDERKSRVIEMRFFGGLTVEETAQALNVSQGTVLRDWRLAKAWLLLELSRRRADHEW